MHIKHFLRISISLILLGIIICGFFLKGDNVYPPFPQVFSGIEEPTRTLKQVFKRKQASYIHSNRTVENHAKQDLFQRPGAGGRRG